MSVTQYGKFETFVNRWSSTLSGNINAGDTTKGVASTSGLPSSGFFRVLIESELIICSGTSGSNLVAVTRGAEGTSAASHNSGTAVGAYLTAGGLDRFLLDARGTPFNRTIAPPLGRVVSDANAILTVSDFSWINQGSATATDSNGGILMQTPAEAGNWNAHLLVRSTPATTFVIKAKVRWGPGTVTPGSASSRMGILLRQNAAGGGNARFVALWVQYGGAKSMCRMTNPTTFSATIDTNSCDHGGSIWLHLRATASEIQGYFSTLGNETSRDENSWWQDGLTSWMTAGPDQWGIFCDAGNGLANQMFTFETIMLEDE